MSGPWPGGYGIPPFPPYAPERSPSSAARQAPPQEFTEDTGEFTIVHTFPPWTEAGNTSRFRALFSHVKDGSIQPAGLALAILDRFGNATLASGATGITVGTVTNDPTGSNSYYSSVQFGASANPGDYVVQWAGTYTPAGGTSLTIRSRVYVKVKKTVAPSQFYFIDTAKA